MKLPVLLELAIVGAVSFFSVSAAQAVLVVSDQSPRQGETIEVRAPAPGAVRFNGRSIKLFENTQKEPVESSAPATAQHAIGTHSVNSAYNCLVAIPADLNPGNYKLSYGQDSLQLNVCSANFPVQRLHLPPSKNNFLATPGEQEAIEAAKQTLTPVRFWNTNFVPPSDARVSSVFGIRRIVNSKLLADYFHTGIDYAAFLGSPVRATAPGVVVLARTGFRLHGNVVVIDHGQGVVSIYIHLQKVLVKPGQHVQAGEIIGKVGQTGRANGPHLHFSLYVNDVATNPAAWYHHSF